MEKEPYRPGLSKDSTLVKLLKEYQEKPNSLVFAALAERYRSKGLVRQALEICNEGLEKHSDFSAGLIVKARCFFDLRRYADCLGLLEKILRQNPENIKAEKLRAEVFQRLGQKRAAIGSFTRIISLMPSDRDAIKSLELLEDFDVSEPISIGGIVHASTDEKPAGRLMDFQVQSVGDAKIDESPRFFIDKIAAEAAWEEESPMGDSTFATKTVAELYLRQGLKEKAKKIIEMMLQRDAKDIWASETLEKLSASSVNKVDLQARRTQLMVKAQYLERLLARVQSYKRLTY